MGLEAQRAAVETFTQMEGFELVETVKEAASGAAKEGELFSLEHRPILSGLVARAESGGFDLLIVATLDRLSRDQVEQLYLKRLFARFGVTVVSAAGETNGNGDAISELIERLIGAVHDSDRKRILERMRAGKEQARKVGRAVSGYAPYGYRTGSSGRFGVVPEQAETVRRIFGMAKEGLGPGPIARRLNAEGVPGPRGPWGRQTITNMLRNPLYAGELHGVKTAQPAIVSRRLFNAAQADAGGRG
jgi:DNA invertase Pin-like site-specific DNA recombinase